MSAPGQLVPTRDANVKTDIFNTAITANTNILSTDLIPAHTPISYFIVYVAMQATGILSVRRTVKGTGTVAENLNNNATLVANTAYTFTVPVSQNETINFQYDASTTAIKFLVLESMEEEDAQSVIED